MTHFIGPASQHDKVFILPRNQSIFYKNLPVTDVRLFKHFIDGIMLVILTSGIAVPCSCSRRLRYTRTRTSFRKSFYSILLFFRLEVLGSSIRGLCLLSRVAPPSRELPILCLLRKTNFDENLDCWNCRPNALHDRSNENAGWGCVGMLDPVQDNLLFILYARWSINGEELLQHWFVDWDLLAAFSREDRKPSMEFPVLEALGLF